jgi:sigma-B regulation protein RsbU (phosphoserine phosphatase)
VDRQLLTRHALPLGVLSFFTLLDLVSGPGQVILGLVVISPLVAASVVRRRSTAVYAGLAFVTAALLGIYDQQYTADALLAQAIRLFGVALGGALAVVACGLRQRREELLTRLSAEAATSRGALQLAETLQRSLLTDPPAVPGLELAVRYLPAVQHAQVGGDWYDAFPLPDGSTMLVIGDVAGHDVSAAATMAQARGVLRGIASTVAASPAGVLGCLDETLQRLGVGTLVTAAVATVSAGAGDGSARLGWSNAGHPPPVLASPDGTVSVLERPADRLLGVSVPAARFDHEVTLAPGDTLVLYTDGLVERRGLPLDDGTAWLVRELEALAGEPLERLCDALLADMPGPREDDVAILAVRIAVRVARG